METQINFDELIEKLNTKSNKARATLMRRLIMGKQPGKGMGPALCRSVIRYACMQLDTINSKYPEDHPYGQRYKLYSEKRNKVPAV